MDSLNLPAPYSPSNSLLAPELFLVDLLPEPTEIPDLENVPYLPHNEHSVTSDGVAEEHDSVIPQDPSSSQGDSDRALFLTSNGRVRLSCFESPSNERGFTPFIPLTEIVLHGTGSAAQEPNNLVEHRIQRLIEVYESQRPRVSRSSGDVTSVSSLTSPDSLTQNIVQSGVSLATAKKNERTRKGKDLDGSKKHGENNEKSALNFECNICLELAKDPVVTPCGHLFCWPCLYQWLFAHSMYSECPVCKGEVIEVNVTPIYGLGKKDSYSGKQCIEGKSNVKIPPRPRASRIANIREQFLRQREAANVNQRPFSDHVVTFRAAVLSTLMSRIPNREASQPNPARVALHASTTSMPHHDPPRIQTRVGLPIAVVEVPGSGIQRTTSLSASEQNSNSSTMAVIQDDIVNAENSAGPSWPVAARTRSRRIRSSSDSPDVDESEQEHSRRRLD